jgi:two-component system, LytTR family, response regulator
MNLKALLVDDESASKMVLRQLLQEYCPEITVVGTAASVPEAVQKINDLAPDVVFLDIEMPILNGFQLFDFFETITFDVIFVTAYNQYAVQAFEVSAIDYLMKPISAERLQHAVAKIVQMGQKDANARQLGRQFIQQKFKSKLMVTHQKGLTLIDLPDVMRLEAQGAYAHIYLHNNKKLTVSNPLGDYEEQLSEAAGFFRVHRSHLVNVYFIEKIELEANQIRLLDSTIIPVSRSRKTEFMAFLKKFSE